MGAQPFNLSIQGAQAARLTQQAAGQPGLLVRPFQNQNKPHNKNFVGLEHRIIILALKTKAGGPQIQGNQEHQGRTSQA